MATERELAKVAAMVERGAASGRGGLQGAAAIGERVGRVINKYQMAKHFTRSITDTSFTYVRDEESIGEEAALDGLYVLRTNVDEEQLDTAGVVLAYKSLAHVEQALPALQAQRPGGTPHLPLHRASSASAPPAVHAGLLGTTGRCSGRWRPCSSWMRRHRRGPTRWRQHLAQRRCWRSTGPNAPPMGFPVHSFPTLLADLGTMVQEPGDPHRESPRRPASTR